jgi:hypothetical protein
LQRWKEMILEDEIVEPKEEQLEFNELGKLENRT